MPFFPVSIAQDLLRRGWLVLIIKKLAECRHMAPIRKHVKKSSKKYPVSVPDFTGSGLRDIAEYAAYGTTWVSGRAVPGNCKYI